MPALEVPDPVRAENLLRELQESPNAAARRLVSEVDRLDAVKNDKEIGDIDLYHLVCCQAKLPLEERKAALRNVIRGLRGPAEDFGGQDGGAVGDGNDNKDKGTENPDARDKSSSGSQGNKEHANNNNNNNNSSSSSESKDKGKTQKIEPQNSTKSPIKPEDRTRLIQRGREAASRLRKNGGKRTEESRGFEQLMMLHLAHLPPEHENNELIEVARTEAAGLTFGDPLLFADVVDGLDEDTRRWLLDASPKGSQPIMSKVLERGGYADQLAASLRILQVAYQQRYLIAAAPVGEFVLSYIFSWYYLCTFRLAHWLYWDSVLYMTSFAVVYHICTILEPTITRLRRDPGGLWERVLLAYQAGSVEEAAAHLEVAADDLETSKRLLGLLGVLLTFGQIWALFGAYYVLLAVWWGYCYLLAICLALGFVGLRLLCYLRLLRFLQHLAHDLQSVNDGLADAPSPAAAGSDGYYGSFGDGAGTGAGPNTAASSV